MYNKTKEYFEYKENVYDLLGFTTLKQKGNKDATLALYTDGVQLYSREVGQFYDLFTQLDRHDLKVCAHILKNK